MSQKSIWEEISERTPGVVARTSVRILPAKQKPSGPRTGAHLGPMAQRAGDRFWYNAVEVAKVVYTKIDARYPHRNDTITAFDIEEAKYLKKQIDEERRLHANRMENAKKILQEARNLIFEAVLPMFVVGPRVAADPFTEADDHAKDYFIRNVYHTMVREYKAWLPDFVDEADVESTEAVLERVAHVHADKLEQELNNFCFAFRPLKDPTQARREGIL